MVTKKQVDQKSMLVFVCDLFLCLKYHIQRRKKKALGHVRCAVFSVGSYSVFIPLNSVSVQ